MAEQKQIEIHNENDIVNARQIGRDIARRNRFSPVDCVQIATAVSELARNIFLYAKTGIVLIRIISSGGKTGIEITSRDNGIGIKNTELVMRDGYSTSNGLGLGLPGVKRIMDDFEIKSELGRGTVVKILKWIKR